MIADIKQKLAAIAKLQEELAEARALLTGERPAGARIEPRPQKAAREDRGRGRPKRRGHAAGHGRVGVPGIVPTSSVGMTLEVLRHAGKPLHVNEIVKAVEVLGKKISKTTLTGNLWRYVKDKRIFYRAGKNTFGLIEMRKG